MANVIQLKTNTFDPVADLLDEWNEHKKKLTFQRFISERMPMFFGPLSSNVSLFEKIKTAERQMDIRFSIQKVDNFWTGDLIQDTLSYQCPKFALEDDLRIFIILLHLKIKVTKKPA